MGRWYNAKLALVGDYRHATPAGYEVVGNMLYKAMLRSFDYLKRSTEFPEFSATILDIN